MMLLARGSLGIVPRAVDEGSTHCTRAMNKQSAEHTIREKVVRPRRGPATGPGAGRPTGTARSRSRTSVTLSYRPLYPTRGR
jgi:hypothetical protein